MNDPTRREYREIFRNEAGRLGISGSDWAVEYLFHEYYEKQGIPPRCCHPRDTLEKIADAARFEGSEPSLDAGILVRVCASYLLNEAADLIICSRFVRTGQVGRAGPSGTPRPAP